VSAAAAALVSDALDEKYTIVGTLAVGTMGHLVRVRDNDLRRDIVVKIVAPELETEAEALERFVAEAQVTGQLEHPNIVPIYEIGLTDERRPYYAMRYVDGCTLGEVVARLAAGDAETHAEYPFARRLQIVLKICEAVSFAHHRGVLHRDLKPDNIMIGRFGEVTVMDWGIASRVGQVEGDSVMCTPAYAAPEVFLQQAVDERTDVYSLGALMYELFCLRAPHAGDSLAGVVTSVLDNEPRRANRLRHRAQGRVPREVANIIARAMAKKPEQRYGSVASLAEAIVDYQKGQAPVVCACTGLKRILYRVADQIDNHGEMIVAALIMLLALPLLGLEWWWLTR
jgi:serine/threonine-protein kinase